MKKAKLLSLPGLIIVVGTSPLFSQPSIAPHVSIRVSWLPEVTVIGGQSTLYYELRVANLAHDSVDLKKLEVMDLKKSGVVARFDDLRNRLGRMGSSAKGKENILAPRDSCVIYLEYILSTGKPALPLMHRLEFEVIAGNNKRHVFSNDGAVFDLADKLPLVLGAPLGKGSWVAVYEPSWERGHRRVIYTVDGKARIPGRFAIDFIKVNEQGKLANGEENEIKNWFGYAADVLAASDGVVASTRNDFPESLTLSEHPGNHEPEKAAGNYISIDIGNNRFIFYEHLKPGSVRVKPGQKIKKGDAIAALGFTGSSTGPHLHFHVADQNSTLGAEGIPFVFENFTILGLYPDVSKLGSERWVPVNSRERKTMKERPGPNAVVRFE